MSLEYSAASRALQDRFDTRRLADRLAEVKVHHEFALTAHGTFTSTTSLSARTSCPAWRGRRRSRLTRRVTYYRRAIPHVCSCKP